MQIAIIGAGFTGLTAALRLSQRGHKVIIFEKEEDIGGLAVGFQKKGWKWTVEKAYHHWFTNDSNILSLASELKHKVIIKRLKTDLLIKNKSVSFDSPISLILFPYLSLTSRIRVAAALAYLKFYNNYKNLEALYAMEWLNKWMGLKATDLIWKPLFKGKFGSYREKISLAWFWARIKKRTPSLAYPQGGFKKFSDKLARKVKTAGGEIFTGIPVISIKQNKGRLMIETNNKSITFDKVLVTSPSPVFAKIAASLPKKYTNRISSIPHLHALSLIIISKKSFFKDTYWLNITESNFPFLVLVDHTNFINPKNYNGEHILYIGNYLETDHKYLKMSESELLKEFTPYLLKLNPDFKKNFKKAYKFIGPYAQPIVTPGYSKKIPGIKTPLKNVYLANLDMVYPWDRGTNYAVELGEKAARVIDLDN